MKRSTLILTGITVFFLFTGFLLKKKLIRLPQDKLAKETPAGEIPKSYSNLFKDESGKLYFRDPESGEQTFAEDVPEFRYREFQIDPAGYNLGLSFDFNAPGFEGIIYYGLIKEKGVSFPQPVYFKKPALIVDGKSTILLTELRGRYDFTNWTETGNLLLGYRIVLDDGTMIYDSRVRAKGKIPFETATTIIHGPFLNQVTPSSAVISFTTNFDSQATVEINGKKFGTPEKSKHHEIAVNNLQPSTKFDYTIRVDDYVRKSWFKTAPENGSREAFSFAFANDSRAGKGGGERNIYGTNAYIEKKLAALAVYHGADFVQFTGDLINGYTTDRQYSLLQYENFKSAIAPFAHRIPFYLGPGNHEALNFDFIRDDKIVATIDKFPWEGHSTESVFAEIVVNPHNGPVSEDGNKYDPDPQTADFPPYDETAFWYTYANTAMIVLNSNYWYAPTWEMIPVTSGNPHAYVMDNQLEWLRQTVMQLEKDPKIDHIFVTIHTPAFPNGGHSHNDMWYNGNNDVRPWIAGKPVDKGIIERRDEILNLLINQSKKTRALLTGDEHNYCRMRIDSNTVMYPQDYAEKKIRISRTFWQITNGSAGAPYYAQEQLPWSDDVEIFTTQYALVFFHVEGDHIRIEVIDPDTLETIETVDLV